jgi:hypothetical protein
MRTTSGTGITRLLRLAEAATDTSLGEHSLAQVVRSTPIWEVSDDDVRPLTDAAKALDRRPAALPAPAGHARMGALSRAFWYMEHPAGKPVVDASRTAVPLRWTGLGLTREQVAGLEVLTRVSVKAPMGASDAVVRTELERAAATIRRINPILDYGGRTDLRAAAADAARDGATFTMYGPRAAKLVDAATVPVASHTRQHVGAVREARYMNVHEHWHREMGLVKAPAWLHEGSAELRAWLDNQGHAREAGKLPTLIDAECPHESVWQYHNAKAATRTVFALAGFDMRTRAGTADALSFMAQRPGRFTPRLAARIAEHNHLPAGAQAQIGSLLSTMASGRVNIDGGKLARLAAVAHGVDIDAANRAGRHAFPELVRALSVSTQLELVGYDVLKPGPTIRRVRAELPSLKGIVEPAEQALANEQLRRAAQAGTSTARDAALATVRATVDASVERRWHMPNAAAETGDAQPAINLLRISDALTAAARVRTSAGRVDATNATFVAALASIPNDMDAVRASAGPDAVVTQERDFESEMLIQALDPRHAMTTGPVPRSRPWTVGNRLLATAEADRLSAGTAALRADERASGTAFGMPG